MRKLSVITIVLVLMIGFAGVKKGLAQNGEVIGNLILPCGCPAYVVFIQDEEYQLIVPNHGERYKISATMIGQEFTITIEGGTSFQANPPYDEWTWIKPDGSEVILSQDSIGDQTAKIVYRHWEKTHPETVI